MSSWQYVTTPRASSSPPGLHGNTISESDNTRKPQKVSNIRYSVSSFLNPIIAISDLAVRVYCSKLVSCVFDGWRNRLERVRELATFQELIVEKGQAAVKRRAFQLWKYCILSKLLSSQVDTRCILCALSSLDCYCSVFVKPYLTQCVYSHFSSSLQGSVV